MSLLSIAGLKVAPALLAALLVTGWLSQLAPLVYAQRSDTETVFLVEFENALSAIFRAKLKLNYPVDDVTRFVLEDYGGIEGVWECVYNMFEGVMGAEKARSLADDVVRDLLKSTGRKFDYWVSRDHFEAFVEAKTTKADFYHAVKEALQDAALARKSGAVSCLSGSSIPRYPAARR